MNAKSSEGQTAVVTGASSGVGLGITRALLECGYRAVANSRTISKSRELKFHRPDLASGGLTSTGN